MSPKVGENLLDWLELAASPSDAELVRLVTQDAITFAARGSCNLRVKRHAWEAMARIAASALASGFYGTPKRPSPKLEVIEMETPFGRVFLTPSDAIVPPHKTGGMS